MRSVAYQDQGKRTLSAGTPAKASSMHMTRMKRSEKNTSLDHLFLCSVSSFLLGLMLTTYRIADWSISHG